MFSKSIFYADSESGIQFFGSTPKTAETTVKVAKNQLFGAIRPSITHK